MCSVAVRHTARPPFVPPDGAGAWGVDRAVDGGPLDGAVDGCVDAGGDALDGAVDGEVAVLDAFRLAGTLVAGAAPGWLGVAEPQAARSDDAAAAAVSHAIRCAQPPVLAAIGRPAQRARRLLMVTVARKNLDMACSSVCRDG